MQIIYPLKSYSFFLGDMFIYIECGFQVRSFINKHINIYPKLIKHLSETDKAFISFDRTDKRKIQFF
jgi:hypothetical protein